MLDTLRSGSLVRVAPERVLRIPFRKHVARFVPRTAEDVPARAGAVETPFLGVAGHVERAVPAESLILSDPRQPLPLKLLSSRMSDRRRARQPCTVVVGWETLSRIRCVGRSLVPADADYRQLGGSFCI